MMKNYKTFLNIILSLSLVLIPSYGYSEVKKSDIKLFKRALKKQYPDFKPPPGFKKALLKLMRLGEAMEKEELELEDYLDQHPGKRALLGDQWLETPEFQEIFLILKEVSQAVEMGQINEYVEQNPQLVEYFKKDIGFREFSKKVIISRKILLAFATLGTIPPYNILVEFLKEVIVRWDILWLIGILGAEILDKRDLIRATDGEVYILPDILLSLSLFEISNYGYGYGSSKVKKSDLKLFKRTLQKQYPGFNPPRGFQQALLRLMRLVAAIEKKELELEDYLDQHPGKRKFLDDQWVETPEFQEIFHILQEVSQAVEMRRINEYVEQNPQLVEYFNKDTGFRELSKKVIVNRDLKFGLMLAILLRTIYIYDVCWLGTTVSYYPGGANFVCKEDLY